MPPFPRRVPVSKLAFAPHKPRFFHSYDHPPANGPFSPVENTILAAAYRHVPAHGFSQRALGLGAREAGFLDISPSILPDGVFSLIRYHLVTRRRDLSRLAASDSDSVRAEKVAQLVWARLMANGAVIHQWQQALAIMAQPRYVPASVTELLLLADEICFLAGDGAVDFSWYSERTCLCAIYSSAELLMTTDKSLGYAETRQFLHRKLAEAEKAGSFVDALGQLASFATKASMNLLRSKGFPV